MLFHVSCLFQFSSVAQSCLTLCEPMNYSTPGCLSVTISQSSLRLTSIEYVMPSSHLILSRSLLLLPSNFPSIRVFSNESTLCMRWPKYWSFSFSIIPSKEIPGLISLRMDWLDFLAVQGTLRSLRQHHSSKASILRHSAFFTVQLSHPYMTTGKTIALTRWTLSSKSRIHVHKFPHNSSTFLTHIHSLAKSVKLHMDVSKTSPRMYSFSFVTCIMKML